jgi:protein-tyrosine phosphatase
MDQIRPWLYIGNYADTLELAELEQAGIGAVLQLAVEVNYSRISSLFLPVSDGAPLPEDSWRKGVEFIRHHQEKKVLVACAMGISRSSTFCIAALKEIEGLSLAEAYRTVKTVHRITMPHQALWESLSDFYDEPAPYRHVIWNRD